MIVHCKKNPFDLYIGRKNGSLSQSKWANPFIIDLDGDRKEVIEKYSNWLESQPNLLQDIGELEGKTLGCWCNYPEQDCHGRILLEKLKQFMEAKTIKQEKVAVIGSRTCTDRKLVFDWLDKRINHIKAVVSGGAQGADSLAAEWCKHRGVPLLTYYPKWYSMDGVYDKGAGFRRNRLIITASDRVVAFHDGVSRGTQHSMDIAKQLNKPLVVINFTPLSQEEIDSYWNLEDQPKIAKEAKKAQKENVGKGIDLSLAQIETLTKFEKSLQDDFERDEQTTEL